MIDTYQTIEQKAEAQFTEKRSRFLAFALPISDESEVKSILSGFKKTYYDARHVCYAYVIGHTGESQRTNDDGEPSGTAGRPILGQILQRKLSNVLVVVVRYFGGVKLGTGPLGVAYKTAAGAALDTAVVKECILTTHFRIAAPYTDADTAMRFVKESGAKIVGRNYTDTDTILDIQIRLADEESLRNKLSNMHKLRYLP